MKTILLLGGVLLAGCASLDQDAGFTNPECRRAMYDDPAVSQGIVNAALAGPTALGRDENGPAMNGRERVSLAVAKQRAYNGCLRNKGLLRGGGVQAVEQ